MFGLKFILKREIFVNMKKLFLDDLRPAPNDSWDVVRSFDEFKAYIIKHGVPDIISFDHDLGLGPNGYDCVKWLIEKNYKIKEFHAHSMNPVGRENIIKLLTWWKEICNKVDK